MKTWFEENASGFAGELFYDEPLSKHTYYRIGGPAQVVAVPRSPDDLAWLARSIRATGAKAFVLGAGSNILAGDSGFSGVVIKTGRLNLEIASLSPGLIHVGASVAISTLLRRAASSGWAGLEFLTGIPGSVGGAVAMNAGTHLGEAKDAILKVEVFDISTGAPRIFENGSLRFEYRKNLFLPEGSIVAATEWRIRPGDPSKVKLAIDETLARRKATQPIDLPSCGSVFKNPRGLPDLTNAWQVIEKLGLRGHRIGGAQFSEKHCNFIVNLGGARAADVQALIELAKSRAADELGVKLEEEVKYLR